MKTRKKRLGMDKTTEAVSRQIAAMESDVFEVGLFKPEAAEAEPAMLPRTWDAESLFRSVGWLRRENRDGRNIYVRPKGEHNLSLVDDLTRDAVAAMKRTGFSPALVVETSPGNYQAWLKHPQQLGVELSTAAARKLAEKFGGDRGAADWRHFGRLAGFTNRKQKYQDAVTGLHPFVRLVEANGSVYQEGERFVAEVKRALEEQTRERERLSQRAAANASHGVSVLKSIDVFRSDPRYCGDGNRVDLAFAIYAFCHGASETEVIAAIRSRDLSHKGTQKRQDDYVDRTIKKAVARMEMAGR
ncbi:MAG: DNA-primase RepB domain-containing protein [Bryobacteraceae bacterium]